jgi:hypothetical protein
MKHRRTAWVVGIAIVGYLVFALCIGESFTEPSHLIGRLIIIGVSVAGFVEALLVCCIVLIAKNNELGKLADYRTSLAIGLVVGLIFAGLTCAKEIRDDIVTHRGSSPEQTPHHKDEQVHL